MRRIIRNISLIVIGLIALGVSFFWFADDWVDYASFENTAYYPSVDALSKVDFCIYQLADFLKWTFGWMFFLAGLAFIAIGATLPWRDENRIVQQELD